MITIDATNPAPAIAPTLTVIPLDAEVTALWLAEIMPPAMGAPSSAVC